MDARLSARTFMLPRFLRPFAVSLLCTASAFAQDAPSSAAIPVAQPRMEERHAEKAAAVCAHKFDLLLIGDSITHGFDNPEFRAVWEQFFAPRRCHLSGLQRRADGEHPVESGETRRREERFFLDVNHVFLRPNGTLDPKLMPDKLHPSPEGALAWARAMEPMLAELFGDQARTVARPAGP